MKKHTLVFRLTILLFFFSTVFLIPKTYASITETEKSRISRQAAKLQIPFIFNQGQTDKEVKFYAKTFAGAVFVTKNGEIVYALPNSEKALAIKEEFIDGKLNEINGEEESLTKVSYFKGSDQSNWNSNISTFNIVNLGEIYEGIELKLKAHGNNVEKLFFIKPEKNPETIKINLKGAKGLKVNEKGELEAETELGNIKFTKPIAYQEDKIPSPHIFSHSPLMGEGRGEGETGEGANAARKYIDVAYVVNGNEYGFKVGDYDRTKELVIDPLLASTFLGGGGYDYYGWNYTSKVIAIDKEGNVFVTGNTRSCDYPTTPGAYDTTHTDPNRYGNCYDDVFISKLNGDLTQLLASTFLGGNDIFNHEISHSIALDSSGNVYVTGNTSSSDFPTTPGAYEPIFNGAYNNVFISKLNNDLTQLLASTFIGQGEGYSLIIDQTNNVYITGKTWVADYPTTPGAYDTTYNGWDVFVSKLSNDLTQLLASTFIGPGQGHSLAIDKSNNIYVTGSTWTGTFPATSSAYDNTYNGMRDGFISKLNSDLTQLLASTFIGGSAFDHSYSLAIDQSGNVYVTGQTKSSDYPITSGAYDANFNEIFISKFNNDLTQLLASTFIGGSEYDKSYSMAIDSSDNIYITGEYAIDPGYNVGKDVFVFKLNNDLTQLLVSILIGGSNVWGAEWGNAPNERGNSIAIDSSDNVYITGITLSVDFPITAGAYDTTHNGSWDIFISKFNFSSLPSMPNQSQGQGSGTNNQGTGNASGLKTAPGIQTAPGLRRK